MLTLLEIDNFKSFNNFKIEFRPLTVLIGTNSVGKSSVLQAIDLLAHFADGTVKDYLAKRNWQPTELKSKLSQASKRNISFCAYFSLNNEYELKWEFTLAPKKDEDTLYCVRERVLDLKSLKVLLYRETKKLSWFDFSKDIKEEFPEIQLFGSMLSLINLEQEDYFNRFPHLTALKRFVMGIQSFELLSPDKMKRTSRYDAADLGIGGERIGAFLHSLGSRQRQQINDKTKEFYPFLREIVTSKKKYGHVLLQMNEAFYGKDSYSVNANYISDGLLRIMAIISLGALGKNYTSILLDEIEDGINPGLAANLISHLGNISRDNNKQIIVTTHSPVLLNYFDEDSIVCLWRNPDGTVLANRMFENPELREHLQFMNPGEVWLNMEQDELEKALTKGLEKHQEGGLDGDS